MKLERASRQRLRINMLVNSPEHRFNSGAGNPSMFDHPVHIGLGDDKEGRGLTLTLTLDEARRLIDSLVSAIAKVEAMK